jgi:hypothetical protein
LSFLLASFLYTGQANPHLPATTKISPAHRASVPEKAPYASFTPGQVLLGMMPRNASAQFDKLRNEVAAFAKWENTQRAALEVAESWYARSGEVTGYGMRECGARAPHRGRARLA